MRRWSIRVRGACFLAILFAIGEGGSVSLWASPPPPICSEVCSESTECSETCYIDMIEFGNGNDISCLDYGVYDGSVPCCGDDVCLQGPDGEECNCAADCGTCEPDPPECDPEEQNCPAGQLCNMLGYCYVVPVCEGSECPQKPNPPNYCIESTCVDNSQCCSQSICLNPDPTNPQSIGWCVPNLVPIPTRPRS